MVGFSGKRKMLHYLPLLPIQVRLLVVYGYTLLMIFIIFNLINSRSNTDSKK